MDWKLFASTFALIFIAELPDKTALANVLMASRANPFGVFLGSCAAFLIQSLVAILFGKAFNLLPPRPVHIATAALFFAFAVAMWLRAPSESGENSKQEKSGQGLWATAASAFLVIFVAEWGDLTQLVTATIAARTGAMLTVFLSATLALWSVTGVTVIIGRSARAFIRPALLQKIAAILFVLVAAVLLGQAFY